MEEGRDLARRYPSAARPRLALSVLDPEEATGFVIPLDRSRGLCRGGGDVDYACGGCGNLIAIGMSPGRLRSLVFACGCGALNQVPDARPSEPWPARSR